MAAIDWLELAGLITWSGRKSQEVFNRLNELLADAKDRNEPVPVNLGKVHGLLHGRGMGSGRQSRLEYHVESGGVTIAFSAREGEKRNLSNWYLKLPGQACVVHGAQRAWDVAHSVVSDVGGVITDEWCRRVDYCIDLPGVNVRDELVPAFERRQFVTTARGWSGHDGPDGKTGFSVGDRGRLLLNVYDKLLDTQKKHDGMYLSIMRRRRWGGTIPNVATRVELQISGKWLREYGLRDAASTVDSLGSVVGKTLSQPHAFFAMTDSVPDRENKHQSRAGVLPLWKFIVDEMQRQAGGVRTRLAPVKRGAPSCSRLYSIIRGCLSSVGAQWGYPCESVNDGVYLLRKLDELNCESDEEWESLWENKARRLGTFSDTMAFPFGEAA